MRVLLLVPLVLATACSELHDVLSPSFTDVRGHVGITNGPHHFLKIYANHKLVGTMSAGQTEDTFVFSVPISTSESSDEYERMVSVPFSIEDLTLNQTSQDTWCSAGAKVITSIDYSLYLGSSTTQYLTCGATYNRIPRDTLRAAQH